ncbi:hypothetical protein MA16_Dca013304 [Dendrobium catenatum]|uniref:Retrovirus-related Pol polyprotein from transposon TNT 1-94-like beta-barrel domain-containing protein n=1 Tax=Dendrobium catenatum TaxID=906689 RepID=A0A2I0WDI7_9ASPA|nr:hypothetical protein MA16_Dca013304 [Dendrobium catenatum]
MAQEEEPFTDECFLDSGASTHLTSDTSNMQTIQPYSSSSQVQVGNGTHLPIAHSGQGILPTLSCKLHLPKILHVPHLTHNLQSVHRLLADNSCYLVFDHNGFTLKDSKTHITLLRGPSSRSLYPIKLPVSTANHRSVPSKSALLSVCTTTSMWHITVSGIPLMVFNNSCLLFLISASTCLLLTVTLVLVPKVTDYHLLYPLLSLQNVLIFYIWMYGVLAQ